MMKYPVIQVESIPAHAGPERPHEHYFIKWEGLKPETSRNRNKLQTQ